MNILITGVAGLIGSNLAAYLLNAGHRVVGVDNFWRGKRETVANLLGENRENFVFLEEDLRRAGVLKTHLETVDHVYHLADVVAGIDYVFANEFQVWRDNVKINATTLNELLDARFSGTLTYVGTSCSYPAHLTSSHRAARALVEEDAYPANPESSYGWSKLIGEYEISLAAREGLVRPTILRLDNVFGAPADLDPARSQFIPASIRKAIRFPDEDFVVWGSGLQRRSFLHVDDVIDALVRTLGESLGPEPVQIGPGESASVAEVVDEIIQISGKNIRPDFDHSRPEGDGDRFADISRARDVLGWSPSVSLANGLRKTYEQIQKELSPTPFSPTEAH